MMSNNKILTVSYGTFSCTLEGFDDSFGTMKAIAEYFRDLSADDRYFGSEPIQPDAQMLARIAEREISRHVEAREDQGRIVLSAQSSPKAAALVAQTALDDVADAVAEATVAAAQEPVSAPSISADDAAADAPTEPTQERKSDHASDAAETDTISVPNSDVEDEQATRADDQADEAAAPEEDIIPSLPDDEVEAFFADRSDPKPAVEDTVSAEPAPVQDRAKADSIADKLKRIRAVVSQQAVAAQAPDYSEDQHADGTVAPTAIAAEDVADIDDTAGEPDQSAVLADTLRDLEDALDADDAIEDTVVADDTDQSADDDIAALLNRLDSEAQEASVSEQTAEDELIAPDGDPAADDTDDTGENILAAMDTVEAVADSEDLDDDNLFEDAKTQQPVIQTPDATPVAPRTRVLKVKRSALEAAIKSGQLEEYEDEDEAPEASARKAPLAGSSSLTDEDEEELARELAELEADMKAGTAVEADQKEAVSAQEPAVEVEAPEVAEPDVAQQGNTEKAKDVRAATASDHETSASDVDDEEFEDSEAPRSDMTGATDKDFSRLMEESDNQMDEPEAATRRDAFAHLRAAVAAKKADEAAGGALDEETTDEPYRDDLANVVRPRRPVSSTDRPRTERPADVRPAPLKLVAEQRIDVDRQRSAVPVRPRRVSAVPDVVSNIPADASSFSEFASEMGATKLPDLLEAAAAYLSFVEGHEEFSRPQLMTKVRQVEKDNFTREDSLRSFGKLLREGKIEKLKGGRFQASEQIGFKPDARAAG